MARGLSINGYNPKGFLDILDGQWWTIDRKLTLAQTKYQCDGYDDLMYQKWCDDNI